VNGSEEEKMKYGLSTKRITHGVACLIGFALCLGLLAHCSKEEPPSKPAEAPLEPIAQEGKLPTRDEIDDEDKWRIEDIYPSDEAWEADFSRLEELLPSLKAFEGRLGKSRKELLECLTQRDQAKQIHGKLHLYAARRRDENTANTTYQALADKVQSLGTRLREATSFIRPEILSIPDKELDKFLRKEEGLEVYRHNLADITRMRPHTLPKEQEAILAMAGEVLTAPYNAFTMLNNADLTYPSIQDEDGNEFELSKSRYYMLLYSPDRRVRRDAYKGFYTSYDAHLNTLASLFSSNIKSDSFIAKTRNYDSCIETALDDANIPISIYNNLVEAVGENLEPLHRWVSLKKRVMGLDDFHPYDTYAPLFPATDKKYSFEEAVAMTLEGVKPLGERYGEVLQTAFEGGWIDVYESVGKRSGAYCASSLGVHPYVLLNYTGTLRDVFTLAHEMGHALHAYFTFEKQPFVYSDYSPFVAEVASTVNEALLLDDLFKRTEDRQEKLALLQRYVDNMVITFYRQTRFAEYDREVHEKLEQGEALTADLLSSIMHDLYQKYWGPEMVVDPEEDISWSRIPHFYYNFYVYSYATSFAASQLLAQKILTEGEPAVNRLLEFLSSGSSDYPVELLKKAGVDMNSKEPIVATAKKFDELLDQMEVLLAEE